MRTLNMPLFARDGMIPVDDVVVVSPGAGVPVRITDPRLVDLLEKFEQGELPALKLVGGYCLLETEENKLAFALYTQYNCSLARYESVPLSYFDEAWQAIYNRYVRNGKNRRAVTVRPFEFEEGPNDL